MSLRVILHAAAAADLQEACNWYETQREGLGQEFLEAFERSLVTIAQWPESNRMVHRDVRRAFLKRFPYGVFYVIAGGQILVVAVMHAKRNPRRWRGRI